MYTNAVAILVAAFVFVAAIISCRAQYSFVLGAGFYDERAAVWRQDQSKLKKRIGELRTASQNFESAIRSIEEISNVSEAFATQPATEQRRLLGILLDSATWKAGELDTTLRTPFQKLRLSNRASRTEQAGKGLDGEEMQNRLPNLDCKTS